MAADVQPVGRRPVGRDWLVPGLVLLVASASLFWRLGDWPWDVDEVETLQDLRLVDTDLASRTSADSQTTRSPQLMPVWYGVQRAVLSGRSVTEGAARLLPALCAVAAVLAAYTWGARAYGRSFGLCLALLVNANPLFLALGQENRFYSMAVLWQLLAQACLLAERGGAGPLLLAVGFALLGMLSHNLLVVYFVLVGMAAVVGYLLHAVRGPVLVRSLVVAAVAVAVYLFHVRPIAQGWNEFLPHRTVTQVLLSFVAETGLPTLALAVVGTAAVIRLPGPRATWYWVVLGALVAAFLVAAPAIIWFFNYRYGVLFSLPVWVLAAYGMQDVGRRLGNGVAAWAWYVAVVLLLLPKVASHYQDGSRPDLRSAAALVETQRTGDEPVYSTLPATLRWYLGREVVRDWKPGANLPEGRCFLVQVGSAWDPPIHVEGRETELLALVGKRRFDEQSHQVRIYQIRPKGQP